MPLDPNLANLVAKADSEAIVGHQIEVCHHSASLHINTVLLSGCFAVL